MNELERIRLARLKKELGEISVEEALDLAILAEDYKNMCGPFDEAYPTFAKQQVVFEEYALLLEKSLTDN